MKKKSLSISSILIFLLSYQFISAQTTFLYGMTQYGGSYGKGAIIRFDISPGRDTVVWNFGGGLDAWNPFGNLLYDSTNGLFYGLSVAGGVNAFGTIFSFNPRTNRDSILWSFRGGLDGLGPEGSLVYDSNNGLYYGTTFTGGVDSFGGTIFSFDPSTNTQSVVWNFGRGMDGFQPTGNLVYDPINGLFYIMTTVGGANHSGAIVSFNPATNSESLVFSFNGNDGADPYADLTYNQSNGLFYGTAYAGGAGSRGAIISFDPTTNSENVVWSFGSGNDGSIPNGNLVSGPSNGLFYTMTEVGGNAGKGAIVSFNPTNNTENLLYSLTGTPLDGYGPYGSLVYNPYDGLFYGMTYLGGSRDSGAIISFNPVNNQENLLWSFGGPSDGAFPYGSLTLYSVTSTGIMGVRNLGDLNIYPNPAQNELYITLPRSADGMITLTDMTGKVMSTTYTYGAASETLSIGALPSGVYVLSYLDGAVCVAKKVVKD